MQKFHEKKPIYYRGNCKEEEAKNLLHYGGTII
jgi:hypothetical protein